MKHIAIAAALVFAFGSASASAETRSTSTKVTKTTPVAPSATASFSGETVAVGVGYTWGNGVLNFKGKDYPFKVDGLTGVGVGVEKMHGTGIVYHLTRASDFAGTYATAGASAAAGKSGGTSSMLKNDKGVVIDFKGKDSGFAVSLAAGGMHVAMAPKSLASK